MIERLIWSCPVPAGGDKGGPFRVLNNIRIALEKHYDRLTIMSGEGMPYEAAHTLAAGSLFDELASFQIDGEYELFFGVGYDSLLQIRQVKQRGRIKCLLEGNPEPKAVTIHMSTEHNHAYNVLKPEYEKYGIKNEPLPPLLRWRGDREHELVDGIIVASNQQRETYEANPRLVGKVHVVGFGVDSKLFHPPPNKIELPATVPEGKQWKITGIKDGGLNVLIAGGNAVRKGLSYLLRAWNDAHLDGILTIMGSDVKLNPSWRTRVLGWVPDEKVPEVYRQNSVFCLPSIEEGQALTVLEAMASGLPVIVTRETGATDFVKNGEHGLVIPSRDTKAIQNALQYFHDNPAEIERMGKNARELAETLTWEAFHKNLIETLEAI